MAIHETVVSFWRCFVSPITVAKRYLFAASIRKFDNAPFDCTRRSSHDRRASAHEQSGFILVCFPAQARSTSIAARLRALLLNSMAIRWIGCPDPRNLSA